MGRMKGTVGVWARVQMNRAGGWMVISGNNCHVLVWISLLIAKSSSMVV